MVPRSTILDALKFATLALVAGCTSTGDPCASAPGSGRFFGGLNSMATGSGEACIGRMNADARLAEDRRSVQQQRATTGLIQAGATTGAVRAAEDRLRRLNANIRTYRDEVTRLRRERGAAQTATLQAQADALERERAAATRTPAGPTPAQMQQLEQNSRDLDAAIRRFSSS